MSDEPGVGLVIRARWIPRGPRRDLRAFAPTGPLIAEVDRAVLAIARLHAAAERDQILVSVHNSPLRGLHCARVVLAAIESDPTPPELFTFANLWPGQSTAHSVFLESPRPSGRPSGTPPNRHVPVV